AVDMHGRRATSPLLIADKAERKPSISIFINLGGQLNYGACDTIRPTRAWCKTRPCGSVMHRAKQNPMRQLPSCTEMCGRMLPVSGATGMGVAGCCVLSGHHVATKASSAATGRNGAASDFAFRLRAPEQLASSALRERLNARERWASASGGARWRPRRAARRPAVAPWRAVARSHERWKSASSSGMRPVILDERRRLEPDRRVACGTGVLGERRARAPRRAAGTKPLGGGEHEAPRRRRARSPSVSGGHGAPRRAASTKLLDERRARSPR
ncbi:hypothetical protein Dimus_035388, partial [Dionaea muscipula]